MKLRGKKPKSGKKTKDKAKKERGRFRKNKKKTDDKVVDRKHRYINLEASSCLCETNIANYRKLKCNDMSAPYDEEKCPDLWQKINNDQAASLCPVDPSQGPCGVPNHLDMYGLGETRGMEFELYGSGKEFNIGNLKVTGLKNYPGLEEWIKEVSKNITVVDGTRFIRWKGVIPDDIGKLIRHNCETLKFTVEDEGSGTSVEFKGLTFGVVHKTGGRRRRLLQNSQMSC